MKLGFLKAFSDKRKIKYGTVTIAFCAIVIALVIVLNSVISVLAESLEWYVDMTKEQAYTVSEQLAQLAIETSKDAKIDVIFCCSSYEAQSIDEDPTGGMLTYVHSTAKQLEKRMSNIRVLYMDPQKDHGFFKENGWAGSATKTNVIIARQNVDGGYGTNYRIHSVDYFFSKDENDQIYGYDAEYVFATDLISLCQDTQPYIYVCQGHGEATDTTEFYTLFVDSGFNLVPIILSNNVFLCENGCDTQFDPSTDAEQNWASYTCTVCKTAYTKDVVLDNLVARPNIPEDARAVIINEPTMDYEDGEISLLRKYLDGQGTIMCFSNPATLKSGADLPNLYGFLEEWGGVKMQNATVTDQGSYSIGMPNSFKGVVTSNAVTQAYLPQLAYGSDIRPQFNNSSHLTIDNRYIPTTDGGYNTGDGERGTLPLLVTGSTATVKGQRGVYNIVTVTYSETYKNNNSDQTNSTNDAYTSYLITCACPDFISDSYIGSDSYPNDEIIYSLIRQTTSAQVPAYIDTKPFANYDLDISESGAQATLITLALVPTALALGAMAVVLIRRKRR
ncbi:MAG: Gldg family protein [Clostridia bacterium]|nr:Gldg family protein [Clostridia bacterium]